MKNRRSMFSFVAAALGAAAVTTNAKASTGEPAWQTGNAVNNQCPVCGFLNPAMIAKASGEPTTGVRTFVRMKSKDVSQKGQTENLTRCLRCNAAFFQDVVQV